MTTFQLEDVDALLGCSALFAEHYAEVTDKSLPMALDVPFYRVLEATGQLMILTCRNNGTIIGYVAVIVRRHPHYVTTLCGFEDGYFLTKAHRKGLLGKQMLEAALVQLKARGVKRVFWHSKLAKNLSLLFTRLGFKHVDELWSKDL